MDFQDFNILTYFGHPSVTKRPVMADRTIRYWLTACCAVALMAGARGQDTLRQGIEGTVYRIGGNHMPDPHHPAGPPAAVRSTIYVFELTNISQVRRQGTSPYYTAIGTRFVKKADTDDKGHFQIGLPPGSYSLFTRKGDLYYASRMDEKNNIAPVEVLPGKVTPVECRVESDHKAVY